MVSVQSASLRAAAYRVVSIGLAVALLPVGTALALQRAQPDDTRPVAMSETSVASGASCPAPEHTPGGADHLGGCWPGAHNTGVPARTTLTAYTGPCDVYSDNVVIDSKRVTCEGMLVYGRNLTIRNSLVIGTVSTNAPGASMRLFDSEVDGGTTDYHAVGGDNITLIRADVHGSQHAVECNFNCVVRDSWLHDTYDGSSLGWHQNAFIAAGSNVEVSHSTLYCVGGCTADLALFAEPTMTYATVDSNLFVASIDSAACVFGGAPAEGNEGVNHHIVFTNNVFQRGDNGRCGLYQPVAYFDPEPSTNVWSGNVWTNGDPVSADY